eukprot:scaffold897_cov402-Prasinococcus_capsulatus_cf.AAC.22
MILAQEAASAYELDSFARFGCKSVRQAVASRVEAELLDQNEPSRNCSVWTNFFYPEGTARECKKFTNMDIRLDVDLESLSLVISGTYADQGTWWPPILSHADL